MEKEHKIFESEEEHDKADNPNNSYYKLSVPFDVICQKCKSKATLYQKYGFAYDSNPVIKCDKCENEVELYGIDG